METNDLAKKYLTFKLNGGEYGINILKVREIKGWAAATQVPNMPAYIKGVINLRGLIIPVIDLRLRFGFEEIDYGPNTVIIVAKIKIKGEEKTAGLIADAVSEVYDVIEENIKPASDVFDATDAEYVEGIAMIDQRIMILLDLNQLVHEGFDS